MNIEEIAETVVGRILEESYPGQSVNAAVAKRLASHLESRKMLREAPVPRTIYSVKQLGKVSPDSLTVDRDGYVTVARDYRYVGSDQIDPAAEECLPIAVIDCGENVEAGVAMVRRAIDRGV